MTRLFRVFIPTSILGLLITEILLISALYTAAIAWQMGELQLYMLYENGIIRVSVVTASILLGLYLNDCYVRVRISSRLVFLQQLCLVIGVAFLLQALLSYGRLDVQMPRQSMLLGSILCLMLLPLWRVAYGAVTLRMLGAERVLFAGTHPLQLLVAGHLKANPEFAMTPVGFVVENEAARAAVKSYKVLGTINELADILRRPVCDRVIFGLSADAPGQAAQRIIEVRQSGHRTENVNRAYEALFGRVSISYLHAADVAYIEGISPRPFTLRLQTVFSWLLALAGLILLSPLLLIIAAAVRLTSPGPVLFRQVRAGQNNVPFVLYKFRSMYTGAEAQTGAVWARENDPRVTPVGRFLRKYRLDELPQLFNVLRGEMSIAGPRPERPEFVSVLAAEVPFFMLRLGVKPGITGWAQINYRYGNSIEDAEVKLEYDLYYLKNFSFGLDLYIMFHTIKTILLTRGAY
ncbi:MAG: hypothetical protein PGMFKBFP_03027 [Anaerolineales bacterium]|nr:hypothetical protein [Anaerolineales bacterium]